MHVYPTWRVVHMCVHRGSTDVYKYNLEDGNSVCVSPMWMVCVCIHMHTIQVTKLNLGLNCLK